MLVAAVGLIGGMCLHLLLFGCVVPSDNSPYGQNADEAPPYAYPHEASWSAPDQHGAFVVDNKNEGCRSCHGVDFDGGFSHISCLDCHADYPHAGGWRDIQGHGVYVDRQPDGPQGCATSCHGADLRGKGSGVSCYSCHATYPHTEHWRSLHGNVTNRDGIDSCATQCHGTDLQGGVSGRSCYDCHRSLGLD